MSEQRLTADGIAALFAERCDASGTCRLTRKQVAWLYGQWEREVRPPTEQRHMDGSLVDGTGKVTYFWSVDILRNRAGILRLRINDFEEKDHARLAELNVELARTDELLALLAGATYDPTGIFRDTALRNKAKLEEEAERLRAHLGIAS